MADLDRRLAALTPAKQELLAKLLRERRGATREEIEPGGPGGVSFAQWQFWFLWQQDPDLGLYNVPMALRLRGDLDAALVEATLREVVRRHEILRTAYRTVDGQPVAEVLDADAFTLDVADLRDLPADDREPAARERVLACAGAGFDISTGLPLRALLVTLGPDDHVLAVVAHHIATDGASTRILFGEFAAIYADLRAGRPSRLPEPPIQYRDFARWQRDRATGDAQERGLQFWQTWLEGVDTSLDLPTDRLRPARSAHRGGRAHHRLPADLTDAVRDLATAQSVTPFMVLLAGLGVVLRRYTGKDDILVGTSASNRPTPHTENLIGCFANTVVLRVRVDGRTSVRDLLTRVRDDVTASYDHQDVPFEKVVGRVSPERAASRNPLFQVMFVHQRADGHAELPGTAVERFPVFNNTAKFDLDLSMLEGPTGVDVSCEYDAEIFDEVRVRRLLSHVELTLREMVAAPDTVVAGLSPLTPDEHRRAATEWNATRVDFPADRTLVDLFADAAGAHPDAVAVAGPGVRLGYAELDRASNRLAHLLVAEGVRPGDVVGVAVERTPDLARVLLAVLKCGAAYLPLDPAHPAERLGFMIGDAGARVVVTVAPVRHRLPGTAPVLVLDDAGDRLAGAPDGPVARPTDATDLCYVIYTSGSTGRPKGVMLDQRGRVNNFTDFNRRFGVGPGDALLSVSSLGFDMTAYDVLGTLAAGATLVLPEPGRERDPGHWLDLAREHRITVWHSVPALLGLLLDAAGDLGVDALPDLRLVLLGGDWIPLAMPDRVRALAPGARVISLGGATEASMDSTIHEVGDVLPHWRSIPYGRPMANQTAYIVDTDGNLAAPGVPGELYLGGAGLAWGYAGAPAQTADRFRPCPFSGVPGDRMYFTGDLARYGEDGLIELLGRTDFQVKIAGNRIELGEVEAALRGHPDVAAAVAAAPQVDGRRTLVGYVVAEPGRALDLDAVRAALQGRLPGYMVPTALMELDRIPLTPNGKVDRGRLPAPDADRGATTARDARPAAGPVEEALAGIWQDLLGRDEVRATEGFFALGGDSVACIRMVTRARAAGLSVTPKMVFEHQTIEELAAAIGAAGADGPEEQAGDAAVTGSYGLAPIQRHMLAVAAARNTPGLYVIQSAFPVPGAVDDAAFTQAWRVLFARHAVLRTAYRDPGSAAPVQVVADAVEPPLAVHDLRGLPVDEQERRVDADLEEIRLRGFDLETAPLIRFTRYRLSDALQLVVQHHHYSLLDGWSCMQLRRELLTAYQAVVTGAEPEPEPARPFAEHVAWLDRQDRQVAGKVWRDHLAGSPGPWAGAPVPYRGRPVRLRYQLDADLLAGLDATARHGGVTFATLVQLAWALVLARRTGGDDVVFGVTTSGRPALPGADTAVGPFINTVPVRVRLDGAGTLVDAARRIQRERIEVDEYAVVDLATMVQGRSLASVLVFDNYPVDGSLAQAAPDPGTEHPLLARDLGLAQTEFPVRVDVLRGPVDALVFTFAPDHEHPDDADDLGPRLVAVLAAVAGRPTAPLHDLRTRPTDRGVA